MRGAQVVPGQAQLAHELAQQGQGDPDDGARVTLDRGDVRPADPVDREGPGDPQRLAGRDVGHDLVVVQIGEVHGRGCRATDHAARPTIVGVPQVDEPVAGVQHAGPTPHPTPPFDGLRVVGRLAVHLAVELEHGVTPQDEEVVREVIVGVVPLDRGDDVLGLGAGEQQCDVAGLEASVHRLGRFDSGILVDRGHPHQRVDPGSEQHAVTGG